MDPIKKRLRFFIIAFVAVMFFGTGSFMLIEHLSFAEALYFVIVTVSTVGYGDILPSSQGGKICASILIFLGVGTFLGVVANATEIMLNKRERHAKYKKLNMLIGIFFSEIGTRLLSVLASFDPNIEKIRKSLFVTADWNEKDFLRVRNQIIGYDFVFQVRGRILEKISTCLSERKDLLIRLLENQNVLEHERFTKLLLAVFHLAEELSYRDDFDKIPPTDQDHLAGDMKRVYHLLVNQWLDYIKYLKGNYPYLFSLALRTNPFDKNASPIVS